MEPQMGIEPTSSEWQSDVLAIVLLRQYRIIKLNGATDGNRTHII